MTNREWTTRIDIHDNYVEKNGRVVDPEEEADIRRKLAEQQEINTQIYSGMTDTELLKFLTEGH